ncbi:MAG: hypothetical protein IJX14_12380 [Clostridia bacterium]|nr:hypothetical protein [Clostridia bacterium]
MSEKIETYIAEFLSGDMRQTALDFIAYLREMGLTFYRDTSPCWKDKIYYWVKCGDACVCFIAIKDPDEPENHWTVWSDDSDAYEDASVAEELRETGWRYVDHCGNCGSCGGGKQKVIFGKKFDGVCGCTFRIDNAGTGELLFLKTMTALRTRDFGR